MRYWTISALPGKHPKFIVTSSILVNSQIVTPPPPFGNSKAPSLPSCAHCMTSMWYWQLFTLTMMVEASNPSSPLSNTKVGRYPKPTSYSRNKATPLQGLAKLSSVSIYPVLQPSNLLFSKNHRLLPHAPLVCPSGSHSIGQSIWFPWLRMITTSFVRMFASLPPHQKYHQDQQPDYRSSTSSIVLVQMKPASPVLPLSPPLASIHLLMPVQILICSNISLALNLLMKTITTFGVYCLSNLLNALGSLTI